jgi:PKD repeat protein
VFATVLFLISKKRTNISYLCLNPFFMRQILFICIVLFYITNDVIGQSTFPYLKTPIDSAVIATSEVNVTFSWNQTQENSYILEIADNSGFIDLVAYTTTELNRTIPLNELPESGFWRIRSGASVTLSRYFEKLDFGSLDNLVYHIDANQGVNEISNRVESWSNLAQDEFHAEQTINNNRPNYIINHINSNNSVKFGGNTGNEFRFLQLPEVFIQLDNYTFIILYDQLSTLGGGLPFILGYANQNFHGGIHCRGTFSNFNDFGAAYSNPDDRHRIEGVGQLGWGLRTMNATEIFLNTSSTNLIGNGSSRMIFDIIGGRLDQPLNFHGHIAKILIFNQQLSTLERLKIERSIIFKYTPFPNLGIDISLCASSTKIGIKPDPIYTSITWSTGATNTDSLTITQNGWYWVETTALGRVMRDSIYVDGLVPVPVLNQSSQTICSGSVLNTSSTIATPSGVDAFWSTGDLGASLAITEEGSYQLHFENAYGCRMSSDVLEIEVNRLPEVQSLGENRNVCTNTQLYFDNQNEGIAPFNYVWSTGSTEQYTTPATPGTQTYSVTVTDAMGCSVVNQVNLTLLVANSPTLAFEHDTVCPLSATTFTNLSTAANGDNISAVSWTFEGVTNSNGNTVTYTPTQATNYLVTLRITTQNGCANELRDTVVIWPYPVVTFTPIGLCQGEVYTFNSDQSSLSPVVEWYWNFDDLASGDDNTSTEQNPTHIFSEIGLYTVSLTARDENTCETTYTEEIAVNPSPEVNFTFNEVCAGQTVSFSNLTTLVAPYVIASTNWQLGAGAVSAQFSPSRLYTTAGTYSIVLTATADNGCSAQQTQTLKIHALPLPAFNSTPSCIGLPTVFTDNSTVPNGEVGSVTWQFNSTTPIEGSPASYTFNTGGNQQVRQIILSAFGCQAITVSSITTNPALQANFSTPSEIFLGGLSVTFTNQSVGATLLEWDIEDYYAGNDENPTIEIPESAIGSTVTAQLVVANSVGCADTLQRTYSVYETRTDIAVTHIYTYTDDEGFVSIGAELTNLGSSTITEADMYLRLLDGPTYKDKWVGELKVGQKKIHVFQMAPFTNNNIQTANEHYICAQAVIKQPASLVDEDLSNNELCINVNEEQLIFIDPYPNPAKEQLTIRLILPFEKTVSLTIYDTNGKKVHTLLNEELLSTGLSEYKVNVAGWAQGTYIILLKSDDFIRRSKFLR